MVAARAGKVFSRGQKNGFVRPKKSKTLYQGDHEKYDREDQQDVDGRAEDVKAQKSDQPKNQKSDYDVPKHTNVIARELPS